eukprot:m.491158 g.491158  ORF g.491158 m.491158 type:complete len:101 (+) comp57255_c0_seq35:4010-4312(+)
MVPHSGLFDIWFYLFVAFGHIWHFRWQELLQHKLVEAKPLPPLSMPIFDSIASNSHSDLASLSEAPASDSDQPSSPLPKTRSLGSRSPSVKSSTSDSSRP